MGKSKKQFYKVRVRAPDGTKSSRRYLASSSQAAASQYKGDGRVMWTQKMGRSRLCEDVVVWDDHSINRLMVDLKSIAKAQTAKNQSILQDMKGKFGEVSSFLFMGDDIVQEIKSKRRERINKKGGYNGREEE